MELSQKSVTERQKIPNVWILNQILLNNMSKEGWTLKINFKDVLS